MAQGGPWYGHLLTVWTFLWVLLGSVDNLCAPVKAYPKMKDKKNITSVNLFDKIFIRFIETTGKHQNTVGYTRIKSFLLIFANKSNVFRSQSIVLLVHTGAITRRLAMVYWKIRIGDQGSRIRDRVKKNCLKQVKKVINYKEYNRRVTPTLTLLLLFRYGQGS